MVKSLQPNTDLLVLHFDLRFQAAIPNGRNTPAKRRRNSIDGPNECQPNKKAPASGGFFQINRLLDDLGNHASTNGTATFANRETQTIFHGDRLDQGNNHFHVVARHYHFNAFRQFAVTGYVGSAEVKLLTVAFEERSVTTAFFLAQYVDFCLELGVRLDATRLGQNLTTLDVVTLGAAQQDTAVLASTTFVEQLAEHLDTSTDGLDGRTQAHDLDFFLDLDDAALDTTSHNGTATGDREHVLDRHQERLVDNAHRIRNVAVQGLNQLAHGRGTHLVVVLAIQSHQPGADHDRR